MLNTKKMKIIIVEGISELQFLNFLTSNFCKSNCIKPLENEILKKCIKEKTIVKKNVYSCQNDTLLALDFEGKCNITAININQVLSAINEENVGLKFEVLIIVDNDTDPKITLEYLKSVIKKLKEGVEQNQQDIMDIDSKYQLESIQTLALPNNQSAGCLENLIINILPQESLQCFNDLISCLKNSTQLLPNENTIAKLKLNYYNTFFTQQGKTDIKTSIKNILENISKQYKHFLPDIEQNPDIKNIIDKLSTLIGKTIDVNHPPLEGG